jgi:twitching motility protein PilI
MLHSFHSQRLTLPQETALEGERFLIFPLQQQQEGLVSLDQLQGVVQVNLKKILPIPETPSSLLGILSWRGEAIWSIDLAQFLGASPTLLEKAGEKMVFSLIATNQEKSLALLVEKFNAVAIYDRQQDLLPMTPGMVSPEMARYFQGYFLSEDRAHPQFLLNIDAIFEILD